MGTTPGVRPVAAGMTGKRFIRVQSKGESSEDILVSPGSKSEDSAGS